MTLQKYLLGIVLSTIFCLIAFFLVVFYVDPSDSGVVGYVAFYASLFFALVGMFTVAGFYFRVWFSRNEIIYAHIGTSFRQGILFSVLVIGSLLLQAYRLLTWWDALLFMVTVILLEFFFMSRSQGRTYLRR